MISEKNIMNVMEKFSDISKEKLSRIQLALEKLARETGEDEYESIITLEELLDIKITYEEFKELNGRNIWIWIIEPFIKKILQSLKKEKIENKILKKEYIKIFEGLNGQLIKYPENIQVCLVHKDIFELMEAEHNINNKFFNCYEWEKIQNTELWNKAEIQIARELIADKLIKKYLQFL